MDATNGTLTAAVTYSNPAVTDHNSAAWFVNVYQASTSTTFSVQKTLVGGSAGDNKTFTFTLKQVANGTATEQVENGKLAAAQTTTITVDGTTATNTSNFANTSVSFDQDDVGTDFWFLIEEDATGVDANGVKDGIKYDAIRQHWIKVTVELGESDALVVKKNDAAVTNDPDASFTNTVLTSIYARKVWTQGDTAQSATFWPANKTVTFQLQQSEDGTNWSDINTDANETTISPVTVSSTENVSFTNLPADKTYRVVETAVDGANLDSPITVRTSGTGTSVEPYVFTNDIPLTGITVTKAWNAGGVTTWPTDIASVTVGLYQTVSGNESQVLNDQSQALTVVLTSSTPSNSFTDLPQYTDDGEAITYSVKEESVLPNGDGATTVTVNNNSFTIGTDQWQVSSTTTGNATTITNTKSNNSITVYKRWYNAYGGYESTVTQTVTAQLYHFEEVAIYDGSTHTSNGHNYTWSDPENVTDQWWKLWQNPISGTETQNGHTIGYTRTNIENRPKKLPVEKKWYKEGDNNTKVLADANDLQALDSITVKLMISFDTDATSSSATWYEGASLTLTKTGSWKGCFEDLDQIVANVISTNNLSNDPRTAKYRIDEVWNEAFKPDEVDIVNHEAQLKNILMPRGSIIVQKQWTVEDPTATAVLLILIYI